MQRITYIDLLRGIAVILVIVQHLNGTIIRQQTLNSTWWVANFFISISKPAVPLFLMCSGALLLSAKKNESIIQFLARRLKKIGIPFIFWVIFYYVFFLYIKQDSFNIKEFLTEFFKGSNTRHLPTHLWYLPMILSIYLVTPILKHFVQHSKNKEYVYFIIVSIFFCNLIPIFTKISGMRVGLYNFIFTTYVFYFFIGFYVCLNTKDIPIRHALLFFITGFLITSLGTFFSTSASGSFDGFFYSNKPPGILLMTISTFIIIKQFFSNTGLHKNFQTILSYIGRLSFGIYLIHAFWIIALDIGLFGVKISINVSHFALSVPILTILVLIISIVSVEVIRLVPLGKYIIPD